MLDRGVGIGDRQLVLEAINAIEVVEAREVIELAIVRLAAERRSEAELTRLRKVLDAMRSSCDDAHALAHHDFDLHIALCDAARNTLLTAGLSAFQGRVQELIARSVTHAIAERRVGALIDARVRLVDAVERRDPERAADVFSTIMHDLRIESGRSWPGTTDDVTSLLMPWTGMLDARTQPKGDRP